MAIVLALLGAISWGSGDYLGGTATRRHRVVTVLVASQVAGLVTLAVAAAAVGGSPTTRDIVLGSSSAAFGVGGLGLLYWALANGTMSVVAPTTAVTSVAVPVVWGLTRGEEISALAGLGIAVGLMAIALISRAQDDAAGDGSGRLSALTSVLVSLASGALFGAFLIVFDSVSEDSGLWPLLAERTTAVPVLIVIALATGSKLVPSGDRRMIAAAGILDSTANAFVLLAVQQGLLTLSAVLSSMYPAMTVALARVVDDERLQRVQVIGLGLAAVAIVCIAGG